MQFNPFRYEKLFVLSEPDKFEHAHQIGLALAELLHAVRFGSIKGATGTRHAVSTTRPKRIRAKAVAQVVVLPDLAATGGTVDDCILVEQHFDGCHILLKIACFGNAAGQFETL